MENPIAWISVADQMVVVHLVTARTVLLFYKQFGMQRFETGVDHGTPRRGVKGECKDSEKNNGRLHRKGGKIEASSTLAVTNDESRC